MFNVHLDFWGVVFLSLQHAVEQDLNFLQHVSVPSDETILLRAIHLQCNRVLRPGFFHLTKETQQAEHRFQGFSRVQIHKCRRLSTSTYDCAEVSSPASLRAACDW